MIIPLQWIGLFAIAALFVVMFALGLMLGGEQFEAALQRRVVLAAAIIGYAIGLAIAIILFRQSRQRAVKGPGPAPIAD